MMPRPEQPESQSPVPGKSNNRRGRPRDAKARQNIVEVTKDLAKSSDSYRSITIDRIAATAGVGKATIYRWWSTKSDLIEEACFSDQLVRPTHGSLQADLTDIILQQAQYNQERTTRQVLSGAIAERIELRPEEEAANAQGQSRTGNSANTLLSLAFHAARERGEWEGECDLATVQDAYYGLLFQRLILRAQPMNESVAKQFARILVAAGRPG